MKKIIKKLLLIMGLIFAISFNGFAQLIEEGCPNNGHSNAKYKVEYLLTYSTEELSKHNINDKVSQIKVVNNDIDCIKLSQFIDQIAKYKGINDNISPEEKLYFYQTNNFYYIFWDREKLYIGPRTLIIVTSKDLSKTWEFFN